MVRYENYVDVMSCTVMLCCLLFRCSILMLLLCCGRMIIVYVYEDVCVIWVVFDIAWSVYRCVDRYVMLQCCCVVMLMCCSVVVLLYCYDVVLLCKCYCAAT